MRRLPALLALLAAATVLVAACGDGDDDGGGGATTAAAEAPLALTDRVCAIEGLVADPAAAPVADVEEFAGLGSATAEDTAAYAAAYRDAGFEEGIFQPMEPEPPGTTGGVCIVIRFADEAGAAADVDFEIAQQEAFAELDDVPFTPFEVPGIPGARGYQRGADDASHGHNIVFADGRHTYVVALGAEIPEPTQEADAVAAARALHARVRGR